MIKTVKAAMLCLTAALGPLAGGNALAQAFPNKPIRIIVPYSPGGTTDLLARLIGQHLSEKWGQSVLVENKPGVNGMIGSDLIAKAPADGYTSASHRLAHMPPMPPCIRRSPTTRSRISHPSRWRSRHRWC